MNRETLNKIIRNRKTIYPTQFSDREIPESVINEILENAIHAPTHRMTQPWFFKIYKGKSKDVLCEIIQKINKEKYSAVKINKFIDKVKKLREVTGAGFKDCNLAIKESNGDLDKAVEILRVKGISKASKKMSRDAKEGVVVVSGDDNKKSVFEVNCETDFVAKNNDFINFVKELSELNNENKSIIEDL